MQLLPIIFAPFIGSFLGVLIRRLPAGQAIVFGRSACASCGSRLAARDLVPVVSFLLLGGRCRRCRAPIGGFHLAIELAAVAVALWAVLAQTEPGWTWASCLLGWTLLTLGWIDVEDMVLPDVLTLPLLLAGLGVTLLLQPRGIADHALGAAVGYVAFRVIAVGYRVWRGRSGLGAGDAKLLAAAGAWLGWQALPWVVFAASLAGIVAAAVAWLLGYHVRRTTAVPFGPFVAISIWLVWLYGMPMQ
jgi:leader peptidase (prepilin peptidase) / N-methyltransferase